ncbi:MAG: EscU/YscU/HrcU family type III secretion system export apparatus switch protein, partial [Planctomycetota bacterium]|nr:EscU/YscU/HrcU family type III secretion system export apparatus switch protein [Planctomycetota bacterium]
MAEAAAQKTEPPTPERLKKAKEEGKVAASQELPLALTMGALLLALSLTAEHIWQWFTEQMVDGFTMGPGYHLDVSSAAGLLAGKGWAVLTLIAPFMVAIGVAGVASGLLVSGWVFAPKAIQPNPQHLNPVEGVKRLFSTRSLVRLVTSWAKLGVMVAIILTYLHGRLGQCLALAWATPLASLKVIMEVIFGLVARFAAGMVVIAIFDVLYQKWQHRKDLRMTRQEVKEERRQHETAPEVRSRLRQMQIEMVRKRMLHEVPRSDVVLVNPTHVAVALAYHADEMDAPQVTAKG